MITKDDDKGDDKKLKGQSKNEFKMFKMESRTIQDQCFVLFFNLNYLNCMFYLIVQIVSVLCCFDVAGHKDEHPTLRN